MRPSVNICFLLKRSGYGDLKSPKTPLDSKYPSRYSRNFEENGIGLGIVAAMTENKKSNSSFAVQAGEISKRLTLSRSYPIPVLSRKESENFADEMEISEIYTCVITYVGNDLIRKHEYFDGASSKIGNRCLSSMNFMESTESMERNFLSFCHLCKKKLHGLDIYIYRGDKAFCSVECRCQQMLSDEAIKLFDDDNSVSPCSAPTILFATTG